MTDFGISSDDLQRLARLVEENGLSELRCTEGDFRVTLRTASYTPSSSVTYAIPGASAAAVGENTEPDSGDDFPPNSFASPETSLNSARQRVRIEAPVMGVFYRSPAPGESSFIEVGDVIEAGQPIGMIEAMKIFSEVLAETSGTVFEIPAKNGALVQPGDALVLLEEVV